MKPIRCVVLDAALRRRSSRLSWLDKSFRSSHAPTVVKRKIPIFCGLLIGLGQAIGVPLPPGGLHLNTGESYTNVYSMMYYCSNSEGGGAGTSLSVSLGQDSLLFGERLTAQVFDSNGVPTFSITFSVTNQIDPPHCVSICLAPTQRFPSVGSIVLSMDNGSVDVAGIYLSSKDNFYCSYVVRMEPELPSGFEKTLIADGLNRPTAMAFAPDGRLFVCEKGGSLRVVRNGVLLSASFLTLGVDAAGDRGLLGVAFDPDFATNQYLYVYYTTATPTIHNRISRFTAAGEVAVAGSEFVLTDLDDVSTSAENNGGTIHFGPDGKLYVAVGDNGKYANAQTLTNRLGKILRLNRDGTVPTDNPFYNTATGDNRAIWALGLRNPYTFAFQAGTGRMFLNDKWAEINEGFAGANYGWTGCSDWNGCHQPGSLDPILNYLHQNDWMIYGCATTAGTFYDPARNLFPAEYAGLYYFGDHCIGWIRALNPTNYTVTAFATAIGPADMKVGPDGRLYCLLDYSGTVWAIGPTRPALHLSIAGDCLVLAWPAISSAGSLLQAASSLTTSAWDAVTNEVIIGYGVKTVTLRATNAAQFYRLFRP